MWSPSASWVTPVSMMCSRDLIMIICLSIMRHSGLHAEWSSCCAKSMSRFRRALMAMFCSFGHSMAIPKHQYISGHVSLRSVTIPLWQKSKNPSIMVQKAQFHRLSMSWSQVKTGQDHLAGSHFLARLEIEQRSFLEISREPGGPSPLSSLVSFLISMVPALQRLIKVSKIFRRGQTWENLQSGMRNIFGSPAWIIGLVLFKCRTIASWDLIVRFHHWVIWWICHDVQLPGERSSVSFKFLTPSWNSKPSRLFVQ